MNREVIIIGASGHGKVVADVVRKSGDIVLGFLDDNPAASQMIVDIPVLGCIQDYTHYVEAEFVIAIGNAAVRKRIAKQLEGVRWYTAIHPSAVVSYQSAHPGKRPLH